MRASPRSPPDFGGVDVMDILPWRSPSRGHDCGVGVENRRLRSVLRARSPREEAGQTSGFRFSTRRNRYGNDQYGWRDESAPHPSGGGLRLRYRTESTARPPLDLGITTSPSGRRVIAAV
ncbi:hypothetical protein HPB50_015958 [Hyalomma asiaticum]|uniref:Uncharacterized protein n=1 Tax=Hyalomma asiaticum TaxID=266040 RepID=A0ACB7TL68_HYAAI|nr:hypothetical protein HPB50_015958 [Hyalomma asiaticum]